ncbi:MAG: TonB-dependent receptor [Rhodobacterales bacterium]|nr:MAG: TonB-dependent receptor [Rhodobacterales bacterium]
MNARILSTSALVCVLSAPAFAQDAIPPAGYADLGTIILSGGLSPVEAERYGRSASVITRRDIQERGLTTVQDALRAVPGVSVNGSGSSFTQVRIRGGEANHTLILIDGVPAAGGDGEYILTGLEVSNIERIEVLRGPQSVYYGSNASSGVVNIITQRGASGRELRGTIEAGGGTTATAFLSSRNDRGGLSLSLSHMDDRGYDYSGSDGERDGITRSTAILSGDYALNDDLKLGFTLRRSNEDYDYDSTSWAALVPSDYVVDDPTQTSERDEMTASVYAEYFMMDRRMSHRLAYNVTDNEQSYNGGAPTETETRALNYRLSWAMDGRDVDGTDHLLNLLIDSSEDSSSSNPIYNRESTSYALEYRGTFAERLNVQLGVRYDDNDVFEDITVWNAAASYRFDNGIRLHASAGTGSVNPSYFELYASAWGYTGNPNLEPERNRSYDIGLEFPILGDRGTLDVTYFNEKLTDEITSISTGPGTFTYINQTGDSTREGVEITGKLAANDWLDVRMGYTYLEARNPDGSVEIRRPRHELSLGATMDAFKGRGSISADLRHVSGNYDTQFFGAYPTLELPSFTTVDLSARYRLNDRVTLTGRVVNLFDTDATDVWGYATRPMTAYVGLEARF